VEDAINLTASVPTTRLLIVEGQPAVRKGLCMLLDAQPDLLVIGQAPDCEVALNLAMSLAPDVILIDGEMPHMDGIAVAGALHSICPQASVIVLSLHDDALRRERAEDAGAAAFVAKSMPAETLLTTIRQVAQLRRAPGKGVGL
jgi:DNA-binding NarL/FixJ family response regulator